ncbi:MAG: cation:proton antiporter [Acidimicrobiales bacterium]
MEHGLDTGLMVAIAATVALWGLLARRIERLDVSAPMVFVVVGFVLANEPVALIDVDVHSETLRSLAEITLALLLFSDAARVNVRELRRDAGIPVRLLLVGLPLTIVVGTAIAMLLFPGLDPWAAAAIAAAVAPTDAALGAQVVEDEHVPSRIRRILNVESGLNDGIATPFVTFFIAGAAAETVSHSSMGPGAALADLAIGVIAGIALGLGGGLALGFARRHGWASPAYHAITVLALAALAYAVSIELGGNGFIGAFVGGMAFGTVVPPKRREATLAFDAQAGELLSFVVWFLFGAVMVAALQEATWQTVAFALLALTVARMLPVAAALGGTHLSGATVAFVGWFGPRGLASIVFGLIAGDALGGSDAEVVLAAVTLTVLVSVVAHGVTARPLARRYGEHVRTRAEAGPEHAAVPVLDGRHTSRSPAPPSDPAAGAGPAA